MTTRAALALALAALGCRPAPAPAPVVAPVSEPPDVAAVPPAPGLEPVDAAGDPCVDFYQYACGPWLAAHPRPAEAPVWARSFSVAEQRTDERLRAILATSASASDPAQRQLGRHWQACMDTDGRTAAGLDAIGPMLTAIDRMRRRDVWAVVGTLHAARVPALFGVHHRTGPSTRTLALWLAGTALGPPSQYDPEQSSAGLAAYRRHVAEVFRLAGRDEPARRADAVLAFESTLVGLQSTMPQLIAEQTQPPAPQSLTALRRATPTIDWDRYFAGLEQALPEQIAVSPADGLVKLAALLQRTDIAVLQDYLRWQTLHSAAPFAGPALAAEHASLFDPEHAGEGLAPGCTAAVASAFGPALGRTYAEQHVSADDRGRLRALAERLRTALHAEVERAAWIDPAARRLVLGRIDSLKIEVAESGPTPPTPSLPEGFLAASLALRRARVARELAGAAEAAALPGTAVNAAMLGEKLELFAGIIQPPFYAPDLPEPVLLGAIGQILAHEFGHVLDPETLASEIAWTPAPATAAAHDERLRCLRDSYARAEVGPGLHVDGDAVAREVFADNLGLRLAHALVRGGSGGPAAERQFFVAWAQLMCTHFTPDALVMMTQIDAPPAPLRVNQPLRLYPGFASAFACAEGTPMRPRDACTPW